MLNEKRVKHMTRMALFEKHEGREYASMLNTNKKDYVSFHDMMGIIMGTVFYLVILGAVVLVLYTFFLSNLNRVIGILGVVVAVVFYIVFLYYYRRIVHKRALRRYRRARQRITRVQQDWDILEEMYEEEARQMSPKTAETQIEAQ